MPLTVNPSIRLSGTVHSGCFYLSRVDHSKGLFISLLTVITRVCLLKFASTCCVCVQFFTALNFFSSFYPAAHTVCPKCTLMKSSAVGCHTVFNQNNVSLCCIILLKVFFLPRRSSRMGGGSTHRRASGTVRRLSAIRWVPSRGRRSLTSP